MSGYESRSAIAKLFVGKMKSYIKCVNVDYESSRIEEFNGRTILIALSDILNCSIRHSTQRQGMKTLHDSSKTTWQWRCLMARTNIKQKVMGSKMPKRALYLSHSLQCFTFNQALEYDIQRDAMVKINDRHEFPFEIDLAEFLDSSADRSQLGPTSCMAFLFIQEISTAVTTLL